MRSTCRLRRSSRPIDLRRETSCTPPMVDDPRDPLSPDTLAVHVGRDPSKHLGAVSTPVYRASTILFPRMADLEASMRGEYAQVGYGLHGMPTVTDFQHAIAT